MSTRQPEKLPRDADALRMLEPLSRDDPAMQEMLASHGLVPRRMAAAGRFVYRPAAKTVAPPQPR